METGQYDILEERIAHLKELYEEKIERIKDNMQSNALALVLQAEKTEYKLETLTTEYQRLEKEISELKEWKSTLNGKITVVVGVILIAVSLVVGALTYFQT